MIIVYIVIKLSFHFLLLLSILEELKMAPRYSRGKAKGEKKKKEEKGNEISNSELFLFLFNLSVSSNNIST